MLDAFDGSFDIFSIDKVGGSDDYPISENWPHLVDEVISNIEKHSSKPVIALGHSLGGVLSFLASHKKPSLFKMVIMLDAPVLGPVKSFLLKLVKCLGLIDAVTPAAKAKKRRTHWASKDDAWHYFRQKPLFRYFSAECLDDFIHYGLTKDGKGEYRLLFDRDKETDIYRTIPHNMPKQCNPHVPIALIYGKDSDIISKLDIVYMRARHNMLILPCPGTHMFPMEHPKTTVLKINEAIATLQKCG